MWQIDLPDGLYASLRMYVVDVEWAESPEDVAVIWFEEKLNHGWFLKHQPDSGFSTGPPSETG